MTKKSILSYFIIMLLLVTMLFTGCSKSDSKAEMFKTLKDMQSIQSYSAKISADMNFKSDDTNLPLKFTMDLKTAGNDALADLNVTYDSLSINLTDFIRMTDGKMYMNFEQIFPLLGIPSNIIKKTWISLPVQKVNEDTKKASIEFSNDIIDSFEKACANLEVTEKDGVYTLNVPKKDIVTFLSSALEEINTNLSSWYDKYINVLDKSGYDAMITEYQKMFGLDFSEEDSKSYIDTLKEDKEEFLKEWPDNYKKAKKALEELKNDLKDENSDASFTLSLSLTGKEGSRKGNSSISFNMEDKNSSSLSSVKTSMKYDFEEIDSVKVTVPDESNIMSSDDLLNTLSAMFGITPEDVVPDDKS